MQQLVRKTLTDQINKVIQREGAMLPRSVVAEVLTEIAKSVGDGPDEQVPLLLDQQGRMIVLEGD